LFIGTSGPRELGGAVDLLRHYKLWPHHHFFCKRSLPSSISETQYFHNVVGETEIRKGEGMELDQLFQNTSYAGDRHAPLHPFDLNSLREAFQIRETTHIDLPYAEKGIPTSTLKNGKSNDRRKHKKQKHRGGEKDKDPKKQRPRNKNTIGDTNKKYTKWVS
ncbi:hypothetical protein RJ640_015917, partial [Escallonia rubra]